MRRILVLTLIFVMLAPSALADVDLGAMSDGDLRQLRDAVNLELASRCPPNGEALLICNIRGCTVTLTAARLATGRQGEAGVALFFDFTNGTGDVAAFQSFAWVQVFQNGVECPSIWVDGTDSADRTTRVQPGATSTDADWGFALTGTTGVIEVQICDVVDWRKPVVGTITIDLAQLD